jgi:hypothetical protein
VPTTKVPLDTTLPWSVRLFAIPPRAPSGWALLTAAAWSIGSLVYCALRNLPFWETFAQIDLLQITIISVTPMATLYALRGAERDLDDLRPLMATGAATPDISFGRVFLLGRRSMTLIGMAGIAIALVLLFSPASWPDGKPAIDHPNFSWAFLRTSVLGWLVARTVGIELAVAWGFSKLGERGVEVDWLEQRPLAPFARKGLRSVFLLLLYSVLFSLFLLEPWGKVVALPMLVLFPALCVAALLLPVSGVHRQLAAAKQAELARVDAALRAEAEANLTPGASAPADARLSNLVAYRGLLDAASTWPFDLAIWLRFFLYVSLGLGSWLGGALVERLVGKALD